MPQLYLQYSCFAFQDIGKTTVISFHFDRGEMYKYLRRNDSLTCFSVTYVILTLHHSLSAHAKSLKPEHSKENLEVNSFLWATHNRHNAKIWILSVQSVVLGSEHFHEIWLTSNKNVLLLSSKIQCNSDQPWHSLKLSIWVCMQHESQGKKKHARNRNIPKSTNEPKRSPPTPVTDES